MSHDEEIKKLMDELRTRRAEMSTLQENLKAVTATATAPRQAVKVTVGPQGEIVELVFPTGAYKNMAPKELADVIKATIGEARATAMKSTWAALAPTMPAGLDVSMWESGEWMTAMEDALPEELTDYRDG